MFLTVGNKMVFFNSLTLSCAKKEKKTNLKKTSLCSVPIEKVSALIRNCFLLTY